MTPAAEALETPRRRHASQHPPPATLQASPPIWPESLAKHHPAATTTTQLGHLLPEPSGAVHKGEKAPGRATQ